HIDRDLARQVPARHSGRDLRDIADLVGQIAAHGVHRVGEVLPRTGDTRHDGLPAELSISAYFTRDARHFRCERTQLVHHRIDGFLELKDFAAYVDGNFFRKVTVGHRDRHLGNVANLSRQVIRHGVHVLGQVFPHTGDFSYLCLSAELAFGADFTR